MSRIQQTEKKFIAETNWDDAFYCAVFCAIIGFVGSISVYNSPRFTSALLFTILASGFAIFAHLYKGVFRMVVDKASGIIVVTRIKWKKIVHEQVKISEVSSVRAERLEWVRARIVLRNGKVIDLPASMNSNGYFFRDWHGNIELAKKIAEFLNVPFEKNL